MFLSESIEMVPSSVFKTVTLNLNILVIWAFTIYGLYLLGLNQVIVLSASMSRFSFNTPTALRFVCRLCCGPERERRPECVQRQ